MNAELGMRPPARRGLRPGGKAELKKWVRELALPAAIVFSLFIVAWLACQGCVTANVRPVKPQEIKITVEGGKAEKAEASMPDISRTMSVSNPEMAFSSACKVLGKTAYISITSIGSYDSQELWKDVKILQSKDIKEVVIYLNSPGGEAFQGMSITDELRLMKASGIRITIEGRGLIASAAVPVFLIADKRIASKNTIFLIHPAALMKWGLFTETLKDLQSQAKMITMLQEGYAESVAACSRLSKEKVLDMMKQDHWFTAQEALEMGFIDEVK